MKLFAVILSCFGLMMVSCAGRRVPAHAAPGCYVIEKSEQVRYDSTRSFYYGRSVCTGHYLMTTEWPVGLSVHVGDTVLVSERGDFLYLINCSGWKQSK